jgi:hypothetical protein
MKNLIDRYIAAEQCLRYWQRERKSLGTLLAPRTDWEIIKARYVRNALLEQVEARLDELIPNQSLIQALS